MLILGRIDLVATFAVAFILFASQAVAQNEEHKLLAQKSILDKDTVAYDIPNCTALIVLSKDQCNACSRNIPDLAKKLTKFGYISSIGMVIDKSLMDCKTDELYLTSSVNPDPLMFFLTDKTVTYKPLHDLHYQSVHLNTTPSLLLFTNFGVEVINSPDVMDDYGRVKSLSFLSDACSHRKQKKPFLQIPFE